MIINVLLCCVMWYDDSLVLFHRNYRKLLLYLLILVITHRHIFDDTKHRAVSLRQLSFLFEPVMVENHGRNSNGNVGLPLEFRCCLSQFHRYCRVLSLSDCRYSLNPLNQTRID